LTLQSIAQGFPLRRAWLLEATHRMSPPGVRPLIALDSTSKLRSRSTSAVLVGRSRRVLGKLFPEPATPRSSPSFTDRDAETPRPHSLAVISRPESTSSRLPTPPNPTQAPSSTDMDGPPMRFRDPTAYEATDSDPHQAYLTWLCCTYRFSQPLGALFRPQPFRPYFIPVTLMGFHLQRLSLNGSQLRLSTTPAPHAVSTTTDNATA
jgi:hypothetical protein